MRSVPCVLVLLFFAVPAGARVSLVPDDPLPGTTSRTSFEEVAPPTPTSPFTVVLTSVDREVAVTVATVGFSYWLHRCTARDCQVYSWGAGQPYPTGAARFSFEPPVSRVAIRVDECPVDGAQQLFVGVVGELGSETAHLTGCQAGNWILVDDDGAIRELRIWGNYRAILDDLVVDFNAAETGPELALAVTTQRSGPSTTLSYLARHVSGSAAPGAILTVLLPPALWGTTTPSDTDGIISAPTPLTPGQTVTTVVETSPPFSCDDAHAVIGVVREGVEANIRDNIATAILLPDPQSFAPREDCGVPGDEDCDGFEGCADADCADDPVCATPDLAPDIENGNPPDPAPPPFPLSESNLERLRPPTPSERVCEIIVNYEKKVFPAYCCQARPALDSPLYTRFLLDCPPKDPNAKESNPPAGANGVDFTTAGATLEYILHYENIGASDAHDVAVIDVLDADLDESTLDIHDGGQYDAATRTLMWIDPVVPPHDPRSVRFTARVRADSKPGTHVRNVATIVFPDAFPPTRIDTNPVLHVIPSPGHSLAPRLFVSQCTPAGTPSEWRVHLANWGLRSAYNAHVRALDAPAGVQVIRGEAGGFAHSMDTAPAEIASVVPFAATPSGDTVEIVAPGGDDPCARINWEISYIDGDGASHTVTVRAVGSAVIAGSDDGGCACHTGSGRPGGGLLFAMVLAVSRLFRRRPGPSRASAGQPAR